MTVKTLRPKDREAWLALRRQDVTASAIGALVGVHDYSSAGQLYFEKTGEAEDAEETPPMQRGRLLEPVALQLMGEQHPEWTIDANAMPGGRYWRDDEARIGATPDALVMDPERDGYGVVQIKSVEPGVFRRNWIDEDSGEITPPLWISLQAIVEAKLTGASWAAVGALVVSFGLDLHLVPVPLKVGVWSKLKAEVDAFWKLVDARTPPPLDYGHDAELINQLHPQDNGATIDLSGDNAFVDAVESRATLKSGIKGLENELTKAEAEIKAKLGEARNAKAGDWTVRWPTIQREAYVVKAGSYRRLTCTQKKGKTNG
jgi:YqaJ-like viral recombinase domain